MENSKNGKVLADLLDSLPTGYSIDMAGRDANKIGITGVVSDSRKVEPGSLFTAIPGQNFDGHQYIPQALERGATAIVGTQSLSGLPVPYVLVKDIRLVLAQLSAAFYDFPARKLTVIGVTGTDGKTTTANLIYSILREAGVPVGMITTVSAKIGEKSLDTGFHVTTPEAPEVQKYLSMMVEEGLSHVVLEATSHGLAQKRVAACDFDIGVVTNITHEHLDYHVTYEGYREAKSTLFTNLVETQPKPQVEKRVAVLNRDDESYSFLHTLLNPHEEKDDDADPQLQVITYGLNPEAEVWAEDVGFRFDSLVFTVKGQDLDFRVQSHLVGAFNVYNCLAAITTTTLGLGIPVEAAQWGILKMPEIPGRMEQVDMGTEFLAFVDFAHTPNALRRSLETARQMTALEAPPGKIIAIFGSAGLRDREKRRLMAEISEELADISILTAEDPRTESLEAILKQMASGAQSKGGQEGRTFYRIPDRAEAIRFGIALAGPGDVVIVLGKGHEQSMCFGELEYPWDDRLAMRAALAEYLGIPGPDMPYLPTQEPKTKRES